jgi:hypothetical protein
VRRRRAQQPSAEEFPTNDHGALHGRAFVAPVNDNGNDLRPAIRAAVDNQANPLKPRAFRKLTSRPLKNVRF